MRWLLAFVLLLLALGPLRTVGCGSSSCYHEGGCDDGNDCTSDVCRSMRWSSAPYEPSCFGDDWSYWCEHDEVDDDTLCEVDSKLGRCEAGECRLDGEAFEPMLDGGV